MRYREFYPQLPLSRFVECFWTLEAEATSEPGNPERILPDGCSELILNFGAGFSQHQGVSTTLQPRNFLVGQMTGPILISPTGAVELIGIRFHPGGTFPFFRVPMQDLTDQVTDLGSLASGLERGLLDATIDLSDMSERVAAIEVLLTTLVLRSSHDSWLLRLASKVVESGGLVSVDQLAHEAGISCRQLERRFLREVGLGPKMLSRILRFQQVFRAVERCDGAWAPVAIECGYYDQAHLIRDFNQFAKQTPTVLFASQSALTESFTRKTRTSDFSNTTTHAFR
jgi:AraC-like DNA-binding protein